MRLLYVKPELKDLSQCSIIAFVRAFRRLSQDYVYDYLGLTGDGKIKIRNLIHAMELKNKYKYIFFEKLLTTSK